MRDEPQPVGHVVARLLDRLVAVLTGDDAVLVAHRARDPRHVVVGDQPAQRRHEPAAAAADDPLAVRVAAEEERAAVRDDDQLATLAHGAKRYRADPERRRRAISTDNGASSGGSHASAASAGSTSLKRVEPGHGISSSRPPISVASSLAIARPSPLPEATEPVEAVEAVEDVRPARRARSPARRRRPTARAARSSASPRSRWRARRRVDDRVLDQDAADLAARAPRRRARARRPATSSSSAWPLVPTPRAELGREQLAERREVEALGATDSRPASIFERSSRSVASLVRRVDLAPDRGHEVGAGLGVELLARKQLEEAGEENSGVRSSCEAFAMNSARARSSRRASPACDRTCARAGRARPGRCRRSAWSNSPSAIRAAARVEPADAPREERREASTRARARTASRARPRAAPLPHDADRVRSLRRGEVSRTTDELRERVGHLGVQLGRCASPCPRDAAPLAALACTPVLRERLLATGSSRRRASCRPAGSSRSTARAGRRATGRRRPARRRAARASSLAHCWLR